MAISNTTLLNKAASYKKALNDAVLQMSFKKTAFLCHSHQDEELAKGLAVLLQESGIELYIDWLDKTMPETPNQETASKIQNKIKETDIFLFLATSNSKSSRWCPWEIGYADSSKKRIYIIPTTNGYTTYGNEYLELYDRIDEGYTDNKYVGLAKFWAGSDRGAYLDNHNF